MKYKLLTPSLALPRSRKLKRRVKTVPFRLFRKVLTGTSAIDITGLSNAFFPYFQGTAIRLSVCPLNSMLFSSCMFEAQPLILRTFSRGQTKINRKQSNRVSQFNCLNLLESYSTNRVHPSIERSRQCNQSPTFHPARTLLLF